MDDCPHCGLTFADFESGKRFGCAHDYNAWEGPVATLLAGYHGADRHVGRRPGSAPEGGDDRTVRRAHLDAALRSAVASEDYEQAARLRDELRQLEQP
jgi:protein arginine kinase activator